LYGTDADNIHDNFRRNAERFVDGKHFIKLEGAALRDFKKSLTGSNPVSEIPRQTRNLTLWTERGAARHAKMLDTDQAWDVFEKLEDCYFTIKKAIYEPQPYAVNPSDKLTKDEADTLRRMMKEGVEKLPREEWAGVSIAGWSKLKAHFGVPYREIPRAEFCEAVSLVARHVAESLTLAAPGHDALPAPQPTAPTLAGRRWLIVVAQDGSETAHALDPEHFFTKINEFPETIRDVGFLATGDELAEIIRACVDRLAGKLAGRARRAA
jgi:hypothetical protein